MSQKVDSRAMREVNRSIVLDMIRRSGSISRTDLARLSSLTKPTVGAIVDGLLASGVIHEVGVGKALRGGGRPARLLALNGESAAYAALSFAVGKIRAAIADATGELRGVLEVDSQNQDPMRAVERGIGLVREAVERAGFPASKLSGLGATVTGVVDAQAGVCVEAAHLGWSRFDLAAALSPIGQIPVVISSSCNASAFAESRIGRANKCQSFVWLEVDRGVSAGIVINGQIFHGHGGLSGEIGRCSVLPGGQELDEVASNQALERIYRDATGARSTSRESHVSVGEIVQAAIDGDTTARDAISSVTEQLGVGVSYVFNLLSPDMVVLGGQLAAAGELAVEGIERALARLSLRSAHGEIRASTLGKDAALRGAVLTVMERSVPSVRLVSTSVNASAS